MALLLDTNPPKFSGQRHFRFDNRWTGDLDCKDVVSKSWQVEVQGSKMFKVFHRVRNTHRELRVWSKAKSFNARKKIIEVKNQLQGIGEEREQGDIGQIRALEKELGEAWVQEESYWRQKARISWMIEGDRKFVILLFSVLGSPREGKRNTISSIQDSLGNWCEDQDDIAKEFVQYFQGLFQSDGTAHIGEVVETIKERVTG